MKEVVIGDTPNSIAVYGRSFDEYDLHIFYGLLLRLEVDENGCWLYRGRKASWNGYGQFEYRNRGRFVHRWIYEALYGPVPEGLEIDHLCRVRHCANPKHLEPVTHQENMDRSVYGVQTHCKNGHPLFGPNLYNHPRGGRVCRTCLAVSQKRWKEHQKAKKRPTA